MFGALSINEGVLDRLDTEDGDGWYMRDVGWGCL